VAASRRGGAIGVRDAYRFALSSPDVDVCISGPSNDAELDEALSALDEGPLSADEDARFRAIGRYVRSKSLIGG